MAEHPEPDFEVIGDLSDAAIEALAALLLSLADVDRNDEAVAGVDQFPEIGAQPQQQVGRIA